MDAMDAPQAKAPLLVMDTPNSRYSTWVRLAVWLVAVCPEAAVI